MMADIPPIENVFIKKAVTIIESHIDDEQFGVSELAKEMNMSRSSLLRKIKKQTNISVSQFIRQVRLQRGMEILRTSSLTVSEVAFKVGFSSTSYFIKCFREFYGYPPGEAGKKVQSKSKDKTFGQPYRTHKLAAIMFTDIQGYTAIMQQDERKALEIRNRHREVFNTITEKFRGKILQYYGDGTLSVFNSANDAVRCGIDLQLAFQEPPQIPVRIGIHSGDIIFTESEIIGDGVNVASRIESLSSAGSVFISAKVYDEIKNKKGIDAVSMGTFELKNVDKPIELFAISNDGLFVPDRQEVRLSSMAKEPREESSTGRNVPSFLKWMIVLLGLVVAGYVLHSVNLLNISIPWNLTSGKSLDKKSIAVLPFINDSNDSSNIYLINGLMEATLNNLQKVKDLRVISRTSVEKYRLERKPIAEIAKELNVYYIVEGSGQKVDNQILLNIQLIEAPIDAHLWSNHYARELNDIFGLQQEIAKDIATEIEAVITPEEAALIDKIPTNNLEAYDLFLKGQDFFFMGTDRGLDSALYYFKKALEKDDQFAHAYADIAIAYYYKDFAQTNKQHTQSINYYADRALLYDPKSPQSLIAKALYYMDSGEHELALPYLEKALEYNPNSALVINSLSDFYTTYVPNTSKYLEYALKGLRLDPGSQDSVSLGYVYLHIANAFIQSGFVGEAERYIDRSLAYDPANIYSAYVKPYIRYAKDRSLSRLKKSLLKTLERDTSRLDVLQEVGKVFYYLRDYENAYKYYKRFMDKRALMNLVIFQGENAKIGWVLKETGHIEQAQAYYEAYKTYADNNKSIYKNLLLSAYYCYQNDFDKAVDYMRLFSQEDDYHYWVVIFLEIDPIFENIKEYPGFIQAMENIKNKFWKRHEEIRDTLVKEGLI